MNEQIKTHIETYPDEIREMFSSLRQLIYKSVSADLTETMWAKLPSYYVVENFIRLIPFKDHINIEAKSVNEHREELAGYKITPKGMLQVYVKQSIPSDILSQIFAETLEEKNMKSLCGADCGNCGFGANNNCKGCEASNGCPFGKQCFIHSYITKGGIESFEQFKLSLIGEFNGLGIPGMPRITELYALNGAFVNLAYPMPSGEKVKLLDDHAVYLGNQVSCEFDDGDGEKCFGLVAGMDFLLVAEYGENCADPELVVYKRR